MSATVKALPVVGANLELYRLDVASLEFQQALHARPGRHYAVALSPAYDIFACGLPDQPAVETRVRIVRLTGGFLAACTCGAAVCWHSAAAWMCAARHHDWLERHAVRWRWLRDAAVAAERWHDAGRFSQKLRECGANELDGDAVANMPAWAGEHPLPQGKDVCRYLRGVVSSEAQSAPQL